MKLWRIAAERYALDKTCDGARLYGGRWNPIGYPVLYAGTTIEIAALEKFVHLAGIAHPPLKLIEITLPADPELVYLPDDFPADWADLPISASAQAFGRQWIDDAKTLVMLVPSAIIPEAKNAVVNTAHPQYRDVVLQIKRDFSFDGRMFK
ncbi:MAG: RES family NAD+ phosphorylase [Pseudomonadota bacterium]